MAYTAAVADSIIDVTNIRDLLVQGDTAYPTITFTLPTGFTGLTWRVRGTFMQFNLATQSDPLSVTEGQTAVTVAWSVGSNFTTYYGEMQIVLIGTDALGNAVAKATGYINVQRDYSISTVEIVDENLFEQLMAELSSSSVMLDQTTEQEIINGVPKLAADRVISDDHHIVDKKHVADAVAAVTADDFNHNDLANKQGGTTDEFYHVTAAEKTVIEHTSGTNTGDQDVSGAISAHNDDAGAHANLIAPFRRPLNGLYDGVDLSTVFASAADFRAAVAAGDFSKIKVGDYWPITLSGTFRDYSSYTVPSGVTYYSDAALTISVGTTATTYEGLYSSATAVSFAISSTTYYVAIGGCLAYFARTLSNAILKLEVGGINPYYNYGDTALASNHIILISRDCLPVTLKMRAENSVWYNTSATNPWLGSALYETLNNSDYGLLKLIADSNLGAYIYSGPNSKGMRWLGETKAAGVATPTSWSWVGRGKIFLPTELEIWNQSVYTNNSYCMGLNNQIDIFKGSTRHIVKGLGNGGSRCNWWSASAYVGSATNFAYVNGNGNPGNNLASYSNGVPACFLLA